jgi:hypothetical protein
MRRIIQQLQEGRVGYKHTTKECMGVSHKRASDHEKIINNDLGSQVIKGAIRSTSHSSLSRVSTAKTNECAFRSSDELQLPFAA